MEIHDSRPVDYGWHTMMTKNVHKAYSFLYTHRKHSDQKLRLFKMHQFYLLSYFVSYRISQLV